MLYLEAWELLPGQEFQPGADPGPDRQQDLRGVLRPNGLGPWQKEELQVAIDKRVRDPEFHVIPVLLPGAERPRREVALAVPDQRVVGRVLQDDE